MGFFDWFNKNKGTKVNSESSKSKEAILPFSVEYSTIPNGNLQIEQTDVKTEDVTRLIISRQPLNIENCPVYSCAVSWYNQNDCQNFSKETGKYESPRAEQYRGVLAEIDIELLQKDPNYCNAVMRSLLNRQRVEKYIENGLQETPEVPCGKYVGGIMRTEEGYKKYFNEKIGRASHNSPLMVARRQKNREEIEARRRRAIDYKKEQIARLQGEIEDMER